MEPWLSNHLLLSTDIIVTPAVPNNSMFSVSGSDNNIQKYNPNPIPTICCSNTHGARHLTCVVHLKPTPCWLLLTSLINQQLLVASSKQTRKPGVTHFLDYFKGIKAIHSHYTDQLNTIVAPHCSTLLGFVQVKMFPSARDCLQCFL